MIKLFPQLIALLFLNSVAQCAEIDLFLQEVKGCNFYLQDQKNNAYLVDTLFNPKSDSIKKPIRIGTFHPLICDNYGVLKIAIKLTFDKRKRDQRVYIYASNIYCRYSAESNESLVAAINLPCANTNEVFEVIKIVTFTNMNHNKSHDFHINIEYKEQETDKLFVNFAPTPRY